MLLGEAYAAQGDATRSVIEWQTARESFEQLGAVLDLRRAETRLAGLPDGEASSSSSKASRRRVMTFMFTDMVDSTRLVELIGDEGWDHLSRWHDQTLRSLIAELEGEEIKTIGDGFFAAFPRPGSAIECAVKIQRRLAEHRQSSGFAPGLRIGIHRAEATRRGLDYAGKGVNVAARIGAAAGAGEILASRETVEAASSSFGHSDPRAVQLKGLAEPIDVVSIDWR
jgi:class 3 adenylate cyclase